MYFPNLAEFRDTAPLIFYTSFDTPLFWKSFVQFYTVTKFLTRFLYCKNKSNVEKYFMSEHSERVKYFQHEKRNFVPPSGHVMFYYLFYYINTKEIPNHFTETVLSCERHDLLCSHSNSGFSHVKITWHFDVWRYHVFTQKLTWYFIGVYIIIECILSTSVTNNNLLSSKWNVNVKFFPIIFDLIHL